MEEQKFVDQFPQPPKHFVDVISDDIPSISELHEEDLYNGKYEVKEEKELGQANKDILKK